MKKTFRKISVLLIVILAMLIMQTACSGSGKKEESTEGQAQEAVISTERENYELTQAEKKSLLKQVAQTAFPKTFEVNLPYEVFADAEIYGTNNKGQAFVWLYV
ncbi:MAG: hypothetical protein IKX76_07250, partial [Eubacterium sp.]|nr:hypothetical protein [Eubacterium sp.]